MKKIFTLFALTVVAISAMAQWVQQASGFTAPSRGIQYMHALNEQVVWASAYDGSGSGATINEFTRTTNGGTTWIPGQVMGGNTYGIGNICAISGQIAYVAIYRGSGNQDNNCGVYKTTDGGATWTQLPGALQGAASFANNVWFWNEMEGMCHGDVRDNYFEIYTTTNGGATWQRVPASSIQNGTPISGEGGWTTVIEAVGDSTIMFGTNKGRVFISNDRGFTWVATNTNMTLATNGGINEIAFTDPLNGIVTQNLAPVQIRRTNDGGMTWTPVVYEGPYLTNSLTAVPGTPSTYVSTGAASGNTGITYSHNAGNSWTYFPETELTQYLATDFVNPTTGWAGAFNVSSTEGGMWKFVGNLLPPLAPTNLTAEVMDDVFVHLDWDAVPNTGNTLIGYYVWRNSAVIASLITDTVFVDEITTNGTYTYAVTALYSNGQSEPSNTVTVNITGIGVRKIELENLKVYPNPVNGNLTITADSRFNKISLSNIAGQNLLEVNVKDNKAIINTSGLSKGLYILTIHAENGIATHKISIR